MFLLETLSAFHLLLTKYISATDQSNLASEAECSAHLSYDNINNVDNKSITLLSNSFGWRQTDIVTYRSVIAPQKMWPNITLVVFEDLLGFKSSSCKG